MKFKFTKDFANNWKANDIVPVKIKNNEEYLVDDVAVINIQLMNGYGYILERDNNEEN